MAKKKDQNEKPQHLVNSNFGQLLAQFVGTNQDSTGIDFHDDQGEISISPALSIVKQKDPYDYIGGRPKKKSKKSALDDLEFGDDDDTFGIKEALDAVSEIDDGDDYDEDFDRLIESAFEEDEDVTLRNNLIALGRKYAIKGAEDAQDTSEVNKAFIRQEQEIGLLIEDINADTIAVQRDIEMLRMSRTKSYKSLADLISSKTSMHSARLAAIKELNSIAKTKFDIISKKERDKNSADDGTGSTSATQAVQKLLAIGRNNLLPEYYENDGGDSSYTISPNTTDGTPETELERMADIPEPVTDGDKFIQHENDAVEYVLDIDSDDGKRIYAVNKYGDVVPDYPMPSNPEALDFRINEMAGEATDQLQRRYRLRRNGVDVGADYKSDEETDE